MTLPWWGVWAAGYLGVLAFIVLRAAFGRVPTLCSGRFLFAFTVTYSSVALLVMLLAGLTVSIADLAWIAALIVATWLTRAHGLVFGEAGPRTSEVIAECARLLCLTGERTVGGYRFAIPGGALEVRLRALGGVATLVSLAAEPPHRKVELLAKLIAKRYRSALPPILRIRMQ